MTSCQTVKVIPPRPTRQKIETPKNFEESALVIIYYETLIREWETWADYTEGKLDKKTE